jgi:hypothetical protein
LLLKGIKTLQTNVQAASEPGNCYWLLTFVLVKHVLVGGEVVINSYVLRHGMRQIEPIYTAWV